MNVERYKKPMPPPRRFFRGTCANVYPSGVASLIVFASVSPGLSHVSVIARRSVSASIKWSIRISVLFRIDRALTSPKFTGDTAMRRLVWLRVARMLGQSIMTVLSRGTMIRLSLRSIVVVALTDTFRGVVILLLMACCLRVPA